jgi:hypothetical protein
MRQTNPFNLVPSVLRWRILAMYNKIGAIKISNGGYVSCTLKHQLQIQIGKLLSVELHWKNQVLKIEKDTMKGTGGNALFRNTKLCFVENLIGVILPYYITTTKLFNWKLIRLLDADEFIKDNI